MALLFILPIACALAALFHKKFEETVAPAIYIITTVLYVSGLVTTFAPGMIAVCALAGISLVYCVIRVVKERGLIRDSFFTIGFFGFLVLSVYFLFFSFGRYLVDYDDFIHWGVGVKVFYQLSDYSNVPYSPDIAFAYPPFVPLWCYFTTKWWITCSTGMMQWGEHLLLVSLLCPLFEDTSRRPKTFRFWFTVFFILAVPFFSSSVNHAYARLSPDILTGFSLFFIMFNYRKFLYKEDPYYFFLVLYSLFAITLIKDPGVIIAAIAVFMIGYINVLLGLPVRKNIKRLCACFISVFVAFSSWHGYLSVCSTGGLGKIFAKFEDFRTPILIVIAFAVLCVLLWVVIGAGFRDRIRKRYQTVRRRVPDCLLLLYVLFCVIMIFTINVGEEELNEFLKNVSTFTFDNSLYYIGNVIQVPLALFAVLLYWAVGKRCIPGLTDLDSVKETTIWNGMFYGFVMYFFFRIVSYEMYQMEFRETLHSFGRYTYQFFAAIMILAFFYAMHRATEKKHLVYLLLFVLVFTKNSMVLSEMFNKSEEEEFYGLEGYNFAFGDKVFLTDVSIDDGGYSLDFKYQVAPANANDAYQATWYLANNLDGRRLTCKEVSGMLSGYNYMYLKNFDDDFREYYADLFEPDTLIDPEHLYRVEQGADGLVKFSLVQ